MASVYSSARSASKSRLGRSGGLLLSTLLACGVIAGSAWAVVSTLGAMQEAASSLSESKKTIVGSLHEKSATAEKLSERVVKVAKFSRLSQPSESELRQKQLTAEAIQVAHQRRISVQLAFAVKREKAKAAMIEAAIARAERSVEDEKKLTGQPTMVTALVEDVSARKDIQPFGLVMQKPDVEEENLLSEIPLPEAKPALETVTIQKPVVEEEQPVARSKREKAKDKNKEDVALAKPERSLFGDLFKGKGVSSTGWPGRGTKVAIYDVSAATVYMPDGTKLRAHSGIGKMRDNPRYEHVKMSGPTPAGIYRLKMRERRFHGVEAIRMTSIDGRDPKNRTGLLTHTNLLRGQKGSHGCVAFQNYEPFLNAFKRGKITMMVVVPELPSSRNQLAALYRKAGA
jgi:hypothetical protein